MITDSRSAASARAARARGAEVLHGVRRNDEIRARSKVPGTRGGSPSGVSVTGVAFRPLGRTGLATPLTPPRRLRRPAPFATERAGPVVDPPSRAHSLHAQRGGGTRSPVLVPEFDCEQQRRGDQLLVAGQTDGALAHRIEQGREAAGGCFHPQLPIDRFSTQGVAAALTSISRGASQRVGCSRSLAAWSLPGSSTTHLTAIEASATDEVASAPGITFSANENGAVRGRPCPRSARCRPTRCRPSCERVLLDRYRFCQRAPDLFLQGEPPGLGPGP